MIAHTSKYLGFLTLTFLFTLQVFAQGVPKAYGSINYYGKWNGRPVSLMLADGYIGASRIKVQMGKTRLIVFNPNSGVIDEYNQLKFIPAKEGRQDYFILDNMQEVYEAAPVFIAGKYHLNNQIISIKFRLIRRRKR